MIVQQPLPSFWHLRSKSLQAKLQCFRRSQPPFCSSGWFKTMCPCTKGGGGGERIPHRIATLGFQIRKRMLTRYIDRSLSLKLYQAVSCHRRTTNGTCSQSWFNIKPFFKKEKRISRVDQSMYQLALMSSNFHYWILLSEERRIFVNVKKFHERHSPPPGSQARSGKHRK